MKYDWLIAGGGVAGICLAEILTREGHSVALLEKKDRLAGETTKGFHEWIHTGSLYTLVPDRLTTLKFLLGAIDDLLEYYVDYQNMNLGPTESGLAVNEHPGGWFNDHYIHYRYRVHRLNLPWAALIARSDDIIRKIKQHDWLRRRGGVLNDYKVNYFADYITNLLKVVRTPDKFFEVRSPDFTTNSRLMLADMLATAVHHGLELKTGCGVVDMKYQNGCHEVVTDEGVIKADNVALCCGKNISDFVEVDVKTSYAPMAVVDGCTSDTRSFVNLDYFTKRCINLIVKDNGIGLAGGITLNKKADCQAYLDYVVKEHQKLNPQIRTLGTYIGEKNEITFKSQDRNYLYHIVNSGERMWSVVPGKYTLGFSLAPEFYRRMYHKNPSKGLNTISDDGTYRAMIQDTYWQEIAKQHQSEKQ